MSLRSFFNPKSVAIVGASRTKGKVGYEILVNMISSGYEGKIFPVNKSTDSVEGLKCYPDLEAIGETPELVIVIVPARFVLDVMNQCVKLGTKAVIIITAGFKEIDDQSGARLQDGLADLANRAGIPVIGPNTFGLINRHNNLNASFTPEFSQTKKGGISAPLSFHF